MSVSAWRKIGRVYDPPSRPRHPKLLTHAANPLPVHIAGDIYRVFYSGRDSLNRSSVGAVDIDLERREVVEDHTEPFFTHGPRGSFYADGVSIGNCYDVDGRRYMLFMGWQRPDSGHWRGDIGRLVLKPDLTLELDSETPFLTVDDVDKVSLSYPWVHRNGRGNFQMWYGSTLTWDAGNGEMLHVINYASSEDGHRWHRRGLAVPYQLGRAQAFSRPTVSVNDRGTYEMWFSYRSGTGETYRIGYALSEDGLSWDLALESAGIDVSAEGWDSEMIEYPFVLSHGGRRYMLYNGNGFGRTGFGLSVMDTN